MRKLLFLLYCLGMLIDKTNAQSGSIDPSKGISVPQFTTAFINAMTDQSKGTTVFDKEENVMKYWDGNEWHNLDPSNANFWTLAGSNLHSTNNSFSFLGGTNLAPLVSGAGNDGTVKIYSPMAGETFSGSQYLNFDKESIQARKGGIYPNFIKTEQNLKLNPFGGYVGINTGSNQIFSNLLVHKSANSNWGSAVFKGTTHYTHFHFDTNEDTYIRGGKDGSKVIINDGSLGNVGVGTNNPDVKLHVQGGLKVTGAMYEPVMVVGWSSFTLDQWGLYDKYFVPNDLTNIHNIILDIPSTSCNSYRPVSVYLPDPGAYPQYQNMVLNISLSANTIKSGGAGVTILHPYGLDEAYVGYLNSELGCNTIRPVSFIRVISDGNKWQSIGGSRSSF